MLVFFVVAQSYNTLLAHQRVLNSSSKKSVCSNITVSADECVILSEKEKIDNLTFPLHVVSGAPGSGNDWVLWLASITSKYCMF